MGVFLIFINPLIHREPVSSRTKLHFGESYPLCRIELIVNFADTVIITGVHSRGVGVECITRNIALGACQQPAFVCWCNVISHLVVCVVNVMVFFNTPGLCFVCALFVCLLISRCIISLCVVNNLFVLYVLCVYHLVPFHAVLCCFVCVWVLRVVSL